MLDIKKVNKLISIITLVFVLLTTFSSVVFADQKSGVQNPIHYTGTDVETGQLENIGGQIITIVSIIGSIASVIVLVVLGLKYMMGSAEEKAEYKKTLMPYVIGASLVFAASAIAGMVYNFSHSISGT